MYKLNDGFAIDPQNLNNDEVLTHAGNKDFEVVFKVRDDVSEERLSEIFETIRGMVRYYRWRKNGKE
jgi:hypothetical protein